MFCGVPMSTRNIARALVSLGHQVVVYTPTSLSNIEELNEGYEILRGENWKALLTRSLDLSIINNGNFSLKGFLLGLLCRTGIVQWYQMMHVPVVSPSLRRIINEALEKFAIRWTMAYVAVSNTALCSRPWIPKSSVKKVIFNSGEELFSSAKMPVASREFDFIFVGRLTEGKGVRVLLEAVEQLDRAGVFFSLLIVGDGDLREELQIRSRNLRSVRVQFAGIKRGLKLVECYDSARTFLFPSTTQPEGLPLVLAEATARHLSIISSDHPVAVEAMGQCARIYPRNQASRLADLMKETLENPSLCNEGAKRSMEIQARFSFATFKRHLEELLAVL